MVKTKAEGEGVCPCVCLGRADEGPCIGAHPPERGGGAGVVCDTPQPPPPSRETAVRGGAIFSQASLKGGYYAFGPQDP